MTQFNYENLDQLLEQSGINGAELGRICKVSRVAVYDWLKQKRGPHQEVMRLFTDRQIGLIQKALAAGDLPLKDAPREERDRLLKEALRKQM